VAGMRAVGSETDGGGISLADDLVHLDPDVGKARAELPVEPPKLRRPRQVLTALGQAMGDAVGPQHLLDRLLAPLVPHLFAPATSQRLVVGRRHRLSFPADVTPPAFRFTSTSRLRCEPLTS